MNDCAMSTIKLWDIEARDESSRRTAQGGGGVRSYGSQRQLHIPSALSQTLTPTRHDIKQPHRPTSPQAPNDPPPPAPPRARTSVSTTLRRAPTAHPGPSSGPAGVVPRLKCTPQTTAHVRSPAAAHVACISLCRHRGARRATRSFAGMDSASMGLGNLVSTDGCVVLLSQISEQKCSKEQLKRERITT